MWISPELELFLSTICAANLARRDSGGSDKEHPECPLMRTLVVWSESMFGKRFFYIIFWGTFEDINVGEQNIALVYGLVARRSAP